jgi:hypothetical protein
MDIPTRLYVAIRNLPKPRKTKYVKNQTHVKLYYRIVELGKVPGLTIGRNGFIYALNSHQAVDKLSRRYDLCGGGMIEKPLPEDCEGREEVQPVLSLYRFHKL